MGDTFLWVGRFLFCYYVLLDMYCIILYVHTFNGFSFYSFYLYTSWYLKQKYLYIAS